MKRRFSILAVLSAAIALLCSGCFLITSADELYTLPQPSKEFSNLQAQIESVLDGGAEYSSPVAGSNRQATQFKDLDGDGQEEVLAFFAKSSDKPLSIMIFNKDGDDYKKAAVIDGDGTAIDSISYTDLDGDGIIELVVGWQMSVSVKMLNVYSIRDYQVSSLVSTNYERYSVVNLSRANASDIIVYRLPATDTAATAEMYSLTDDGEVITSNTRLSEGIEEIYSIKTGNIQGGIAAVFVDSTDMNGSTLTDILTIKKSGEINNITLNAKTRRSDSTLRAYAYVVNCSDINSDGILEVPMPRELESTGETVYRVIDWMSFRQNGKSVHVLTTYHNYSDSWYLILPDSWCENLTIRREDTVSGERVIVMSQLTGSGEDAECEDFLKIYALSGENREERSHMGNRFIVKTGDETIYSAEILDTKMEIEISPELIKDNFKIIYTDWFAGT